MSQNKVKHIIQIISRDDVIIKNGKKTVSQNLHFKMEWRYAELQPDVHKTINSYSEFLAETNYSSGPSESKRERKLGENYSVLCTKPTKRGDIKFSTANFVSYYKDIYYEKVDCYTLSQLIEKLPAEDMIEYLKDRGVEGYLGNIIGRG